MTLINPLDLEALFIDLFSGTSFIFSILMGLFVGFYGARFRMPTIIILLMFGLLGVILTPIGTWMYIGILILGGIMIGFMVNKLVK